MNGVIGAGVILSVMGGGVFYNVLAAPSAWPPSPSPVRVSLGFGATQWRAVGSIHNVPPMRPPVLGGVWVCAGVEWLVPKSPVAFHSLGLLPVCLSAWLSTRCTPA